MNGRRLIWRIAVAIIIFTLLLSAGADQQHSTANPNNAGWEEVGTGSATGGGISDNGGGSWDPSIAITPNGIPYVAWTDADAGDNEIYVRRWNGSSWEEVGPGSANGGGISDNHGASNYPSTAVAPDGTPYIAWQDNTSGDFEIYVRRWNGNSWEEVGAGSATGGGISNNSGGSSFPSMAVAPNGIPYIAWGDGSGGDWEIYIRRWNGNSWEEVGTSSASGGGISNNDGLSGSPLVAITSDSTPYITWHDDSSGNYEIYVRRWNGSFWEEVGAGSATGGGISDNDGWSQGSSIAIAPNGTPYVAWHDESGGDYDCEIYIRHWNGSFWEEVGPGSATGGGISNNSGDSAWTSIAVAPDNTPCVTWHDDSSGNWEIYIRRWDGSFWGEVGIGSASGGGISNNSGGSYWPSIAVAPDGTPYVAWEDNSNGDWEIYVRRYTGWEPTHRTITGNVADGHGHSLPGVFVGLLRDADVSYAMTTTTDSNGFYVFNNIPLADTYKVRVILRDGSGKTRIHWGQHGLFVGVSTQPFSFAVGQTSKTVHVHFTDASLDSGLIPTDVLDDLAVMFYHAQQVNNFVRNTLGDSDFQPVEAVWGFCPLGERAYYCPVVDPDLCPHERWVYISTGRSRWDHPNRPMNREWHENFHHLMNEILTWPTYHPCESGSCETEDCVNGDCNHGGYPNHCTVDSWVEGWAEFWPCVLWDTLEYLDPHLYRWAGARPVNFEENWKVWDYQGSHSREEFAVASLLWDLYDPINPADNDFIDLTISQIWDNVIRKAYNDMSDMKDVYDALVAAGIGAGDFDKDGLSDLKELFIAHGFFVDTYGGVSNQRYDSGEEVGRAAYVGKEGRRNTPYPENAYLLVNVVDKHGNPVSDCTLTVSVEYEPPNDYLDYDFEVELKQATRNMVGLAPSPTSRPETMRITVKSPGGSVSQEYSITNDEYWQKVEDSTTGYAEEVTFVVEYKIYLPLITKGR